MNQFNHSDVPTQHDDFDQALEAVMQQEERNARSASTDLSSHPIYGMLLEGPGELNLLIEGPAKMPLTDFHVPEVTIATRVKAIGEYFNATLTAEHWQALVDQHPAAVHIQHELEAALQATISPDGKHWSVDGLVPLMDRLDGLGFQTAFDKSTMTFSIVFSEGAAVCLKDVQHDLKNKDLIDMLNSTGSFMDVTHPSVLVGHREAGWTDPARSYSRSLAWTVRLATPSLNMALLHVPTKPSNKEYIYSS